LWQERYDRHLPYHLSVAIQIQTLLIAPGGRKIMTSCFLGSRSRRAAALGLLCAWAAVVQANRANAQQMVMGDRYGGGGGGAVISDGNVSPACCEYGPACSYGYGDYQCYGDCDGCNQCDGGCGQCDNGCCHSCFSGWISAEYLAWRLSGQNLPPLVTSTPIGATTPTGVIQGSLSDPNATVISGDDRVNDNWRSGFRLGAGLWLDCCHTCGLGFDYFQLGDDDYDFVSPEGASIVTGRPFFNTGLATQDLELVSKDNEVTGTANVHGGDNFKGAGATFNRSIWCCCDCCNSSNLSVISGYRFYRYDSDLSVRENLVIGQNTQTQIIPGTTIDLIDSFRVRNEFNGGDIGLQGYKQCKCVWFDGMAKVGLGQNVRTVTISGQTTYDIPGPGAGTGVQTLQGGLLTSSATNIGRYRDTDFAVIPEFKAGVGVCLTKCCSVHSGYDCIIWPDVMRAADTLPPNLAVDTNNSPPVNGSGGADPRFPGFHGSQLVAHGIDASIQWQW
jgi:hypothetical protein